MTSSWGVNIAAADFITWINKGVHHDPALSAALTPWFLALLAPPLRSAAQGPNLVSCASASNL